MHQQINLYQPVFRAQRKIFSSRTIGTALAIVAVALVTLWFYGTWKVGRLEREVEQFARQDKTRAANLANGSAAFAAQANPAEIEARISALSEQLDRRARALNALRSGAAGSTEGFAARLEALARRHVDGLWLESLAFGGAERSMSVSGSAVDARLVPRYLEELQDEPALAGARFDHVDIGESKDAASLIAFHLTNSSVDRQRPANGRPADDKT
jgi:hypothetical protein